MNRERDHRRRRFSDRDCGEVEPSRNSVLPWVISERRSLHFDDLGRGYGIASFQRAFLHADKFLPENPLNWQTRATFQLIYCNCIRKLRYNYDSIEFACIHFSI